MKLERYEKPATTLLTLEETTLMAGSGHDRNEADSKQRNEVVWQPANDSDKITLPHYNIWND